MLLSALGMDVVKIAEVTSADAARDVLHNFNTDGFESLQLKYGGGRPPKFTLAQRPAIKQIAMARPSDHGLPFSTWSLSRSWPTTWSPRGWSTTSLTKGSGSCCVRRESSFKP